MIEPQTVYDVKPEGWTAQEFRIAQRMIAEGFNPTLDMVRNILPELSIGNLTKLQSDLWASFEVVVRDNIGGIMKAISITNPMIDVQDWKPANLDFTALWDGLHLKLSVNENEGFLSFLAFESRERPCKFITNPLRERDIEDIAPIMLAQYYYDINRERRHGGSHRTDKLPNEFTFPKKFRKKMQEHYLRLKAISKEKRLRENAEYNLLRQERSKYG